MIKSSANVPAVVYILPEAKKKMDLYVSLAQGEVSGLGKIRKLDRGVLLVEEILIFDQKCTAADTLLNQAKIADYIEEMIISGQDPSCIRFWWHSHANMDPFWSQTDSRTIFGFNNEWMVSLVTNYAGEYLCRIDSFQPVQTTANKIPFRVYLENNDPQFCAGIKKEMAEKVKFYVPKVVTVPVSKGNRLTTGAITVEDEPFFDEEFDMSAYAEGGPSGFIETVGIDIP